MEIRISVRNLIEFVLRSGDLDSGFVGSSRMVEGTLYHQKHQNSLGEGYNAEVPLKFTMEYKGFTLTLEGRADGIFEENGHTVVDEIKTTGLPLELVNEEHNILHWAQVKFYAYIYAEQNGFKEISFQVTYINIDTQDSRIFRKHLIYEELKDYFYSIINKYILWAELQYNWNSRRDESIKNLKFPFEAYRKGQKGLIKAAYRTMKEGNKLFAQAPTGTGKTISVLFPAVKAIGEGHISKVFYLTARTTTRQIAEEAFERMNKCGLQFKIVTLTAKDKVCFDKGASCSPESCEFAKGYYDRVNEAIFAILKEQSNITRDILENFARKFRICPFEFSLDLTLWADCVICDYNYVFDPRVYLKRFFLNNKGEYAFLVDEAHNLADRAREMYSSQLLKSAFLKIKKNFKNISKDISKAAGKINSYFIDLGKQCESNQGPIVQTEEPKELYPLLKAFAKEVDPWLTQNGVSLLFEELQSLYFDVLFFMKVSELYDERFVTYFEPLRNDLRVRMYCLDPSFLLKKFSNTGKTAIFFSATLTPLDYFRSILGGDENSFLMKLQSPFDSENLCLLIADRIPTRYKERYKSYQSIADFIKALVLQKKGNYMVYFPSYQYMNEVVQRFRETAYGIEIAVQSPVMSDEERISFLERFVPDGGQTLVGFCVMGGVFSEGVDLPGDRLIGAIIVGVGLPQINLEQNIIMAHFKERNGLGFEYSYMYPGMNKVLQAAGRVIRTENDRGVVMLIDERFSTDRYEELFPNEWSHNIKVRTISDVEDELQRFWK